MLPPLTFNPVYRRYLWGGRRFATTLGRELPPGDDFAESWELVDHGDDQSVVAAGPLAGTTVQVPARTVLRPSRPANRTTTSPWSGPVPNTRIGWFRWRTM
jgi:hypothetical protein